MERDLVLQTASCFTVEEFGIYYARNTSGFQRIREFEHSLIKNEQFHINGFCSVCEQPSAFEVDLLHCNETSFGKVPNWRERLICRICGLNNRTRAVLGLMKSRIPKENLVYFTEANTSASIKGSESFQNSVSSDYLNAGAMTFRSGLQLSACGVERNVDAIACFDMLDRIGQPRATLADLHRRLRPGGQLFLTVPFLLNSATSVPQTLDLASEQSSQISHEECKADATTSGPVTFGWDLLRAMTEVGFIGARVELYWSYVLGHLGAPQMLITANVRRRFK